jgi:hypothetical protein
MGSVNACCITGPSTSFVAGGNADADAVGAGSFRSDKGDQERARRSGVIKGSGITGLVLAVPLLALLVAVAVTTAFGVDLVRARDGELPPLLPPPPL